MAVLFNLAARVSQCNPDNAAAREWQSGRVPLCSAPPDEDNVKKVLPESPPRAAGPQTWDHRQVVALSAWVASSEATACVVEARVLEAAEVQGHGGCFTAGPVST